MRFLPQWVSFRSASTQVDTRTKLVDRTGATMEEVVSSIRRMSDIMGENMTATQEQSGGIEQVNQAIDHMDEATQRKAALVEESVAAALMQEQAAKLAGVVGVFKLGHVAVPVKREPLLRAAPAVRKPVAALGKPAARVKPAGEAVALCRRRL